MIGDGVGKIIRSAIVVGAVEMENGDTVSSVVGLNVRARKK